jgi:hypothetical protein
MVYPNDNGNPSARRAETHISRGGRRDMLVVIVLLALILGCLLVGPFWTLMIGVAIAAIAAACALMIFACRVIIKIFEMARGGIDKLTENINQSIPERETPANRRKATAILIVIIIVAAIYAWGFIGLHNASDATATSVASPPTPIAAGSRCDTPGVASSIVRDSFPRSEYGLIVHGVQVIGVLPDHTCLVEITSNYHGALKYKFKYDETTAKANFDLIP